MVLTVHHLGYSQSERVVWLCEELGVQYELKKYNRSPLLSPPEYLELHPMGAAPVITDGDVKLAESEACVEYIINIHGNGKLTVKPGQKNYTDYLYWYHFTNGTLQPSIGRIMTLKFTGLSDDHPVLSRNLDRLYRALGYINRRLGEASWLAGEEFTAADIMIVFTWQWVFRSGGFLGEAANIQAVSTMRSFYPLDLSKYTNIVSYFQRVAKREGYQRAMQKGDPDIDIKDILQGPPPKRFPGINI